MLLKGLWRLQSVAEIEIDCQNPSCKDLETSLVETPGNDQSHVFLLLSGRWKLPAVAR